MQDEPNKSNNQELVHELWLIYAQLKDAETDKAACAQLVSSARERLGRVVNALNRQSSEANALH